MGLAKKMCVWMGGGLGKRVWFRFRLVSLFFFYIQMLLYKSKVYIYMKMRVDGKSFQEQSIENLFEHFE